MTERPILFSAPMVRALLAGTKTQTRRVVKHAREIDAFSPCEVPGEWRIGVMEAGVTADMGCMRCPFGTPGDRLWVRETWGVGTRPDPFEGWRDGIEYRADEALLEEGDDLPLNAVTPPADVDFDKYAGRWWPSIHMPRWASRITLEVTAVRVERLQAISDADARAEGVERNVDDGVEYFGPLNHGHIDPRVAYRSLWESINGDGSWEANPWVWAISFKRVTP